jgi:hypothetical protein
MQTIFLKYYTFCGFYQNTPILAPKTGRQGGADRARHGIGGYIFGGSPKNAVFDTENAVFDRRKTGGKVSEGEAATESEGIIRQKTK